MRYIILVIVLALIAVWGDPVNAQTNDEVWATAAVDKETIVEKYCKPYLYVNQGREIMPYYFSQRIKNKQTAYTVMVVCMAYSAGFVDGVYDEKTKSK